MHAFSVHKLAVNYNIRRIKRDGMV